MLHYGSSEVENQLLLWEFRELGASVGLSLDVLCHNNGDGDLQVGYRLLAISFILLADLYVNANEITGSTAKPAEWVAA